MKIQSVKIHNYKNLVSEQLEIGGKNVYLVAGNRKGKTSFIDAVFKGVTGKGFPPKPITDGNKKGMIEIDLGDFIARTKFKNNRATEFELENKSFTEESDKFIKSPRTYLEKRVGVLDFDVHKFLNLTSKKQVDYICKNLGINFTDIEIAIEEIVDTRKVNKARLKVLQGTTDYYDALNLKKPLIDIVAVSKEIEAETALTSKIAAVEAGVNTRIERVKIIEARKEVLEKELLNLDNELNGFIDVDENGAELIKKGLILEIDAGENWVKTEKLKLKSDEDLAALIVTRDTATATNKEISTAKTLKLIDDEIEELETDINQANEDVEAQRVLKDKKLSNSLSIDGLTYDSVEERFLYDGLPFQKDQINTASQLIIGLKIAAFMLKDLRILRVDASLIDKKEFEKVLSWAKAEDIELFVEIVDREATKLNITVE